MADVAKNTVKVGRTYYTPGQEISGLTAAQRKELLAADAILVTEEPNSAAEESREPVAKKGAKKRGKKGPKLVPEEESESAADESGEGEEVDQTDELEADEAGEGEELGQAEEAEADAKKDAE